MTPDSSSRRLARLPRFTALAALALTQTGCLINISGTKVVGGSAARVAIDFESEAGMAAFVSHVGRRYPAEKNLGGGVFAIPFIIAVSEQRVLSENAHFNAAVAQTDLNRNGTLSDAELRTARIAIHEKKPTE